MIKAAAMNESQYDEAVQLYEEVLRQNSTNLAASDIMIKFHQKMSVIEEALEKVNISLNSDDYSMLEMAARSWH